MHIAVIKSINYLSRKCIYFREKNHLNVARIRQVECSYLQCVKKKVYHKFQLWKWIWAQSKNAKKNNDEFLLSLKRKLYKSIFIKKLLKTFVFKNDFHTPNNDSSKQQYIYAYNYKNSCTWLFSILTKLAQQIFSSSHHDTKKLVVDRKYIYALYVYRQSKGNSYMDMYNVKEIV